MAIWSSRKELVTWWEEIGGVPTACTAWIQKRPTTSQWMSPSPSVSFTCMQFVCLFFFFPFSSWAIAASQCSECNKYQQLHVKDNRSVWREQHGGPMGQTHVQHCSSACRKWQRQRAIGDSVWEGRRFHAPERLAVSTSNAMPSDFACVVCSSSTWRAPEFLYLRACCPVASCLQKVLFNGEECVMPPFYPDVPKEAIVAAPFPTLALSSMLLVLLAWMWHQNPNMPWIRKFNKLSHVGSLISLSFERQLLSRHHTLFIIYCTVQVPWNGIDKLQWTCRMAVSHLARSPDELSSQSWGRNCAAPRGCSTFAYIPFKSKWVHPTTAWLHTISYHHELPCGLLQMTLFPQISLSYSLSLAPHIAPFPDGPLRTTWVSL